MRLIQEEKMKSEQKYFLEINIQKKKKKPHATGKKQLWHLVLTFRKEFHLHYWKSKFTMVTASLHIIFISKKGIYKEWSTLY